MAAEVGQQMPYDDECRKVYAYLQKGFIASRDRRDEIATEYRISVIGSHDAIRADIEQDVMNISLNAIKQKGHIDSSLYDGSRGGFAVICEEKEGGRGLTERFILTELTEEVEGARREIKQRMPGTALSDIMIDGKVFSNVLNANEEYRTALEEKVHRTVLFILRLENAKTDYGFEHKEVEDIPPDNIEKILLPMRLREGIEREQQYFEGFFEKIEYVEDRLIEKLEYGYEKEYGSSTMDHTLEFMNIRVPDYQTHLTRELKTRVEAGKDSGFFTHIAPTKPTK